MWYNNCISFSVPHSPEELRCGRLIREINMNIEIARINQGIENDPKGYVSAVNEDYLYKLTKIDLVEPVSKRTRNCFE